MNNSRKEAFCSWSGGKESALSLYRALKEDFHVPYLVNMVTEDGVYSRTHGLTASLLADQANAIGTGLIQRRATWDSYEAQFKTVLNVLHERGVRYGIFGDIDLEGHREWVERISRQSGMDAVLPLWLNYRKDLLHEFVQSGFKAIVVAVDTRYLDHGWIGREIDHEFIRDISSCSVDICGEAGEYHTFVYDGPIFSRQVKFEKGDIRNLDLYAVLDIRPYPLKDI